MITIDHPHLRDRIAEYANDKNIITLLLYHILPDGALCSPGKDLEPVQHTVYRMRDRSGRPGRMQHTG